MNSIVQKKYDELDKANKYECWYLVKQPTSFENICYLVSFLEEYKEDNHGVSLQEYISQKISSLSANKPHVELSNNYRALRVAAFFGLITMTSSKYEEAKITDAFIQIKERCSGQFEDTDKYIDIIERQIEKMFISSEVDEQSQTVRKQFRLYPVMLLYKVLLEIGRATGEYKVAMDEYRYLIATTKVFKDFLETLILIKAFREDKSVNDTFGVFREKFDNRLIQALKQLPSLDVEYESISLKEDKIADVAKKVFLFEENPDIFATDNYLYFLGSTKSLFDLQNIQDKKRTIGYSEGATDLNLDERTRLTTGCNVLLYGVPGSGKSWTIEHEYCKPGSVVERLVFHPDYTYSDFIGQILPAVSEDGQVSYKFTPGPFTNILRESYNNPSKEYILIIEEINRGNAPAIFGEVFQLLDRKVEIRDIDDNGYPIGTSEYGITNMNIAEEMYGKDRKTEKVRIPSNLSIIGTMNTSDQNVFTLDTAFQRRWDMRLIENNFASVDSSLADAEILDTGITWKDFCVEINKIVVGNSARMTSAEDKRLGAYFVHVHDLKYDDTMGDLKEYDTLRVKETSGSLTDDEKSRIAVIRDAMRQNRKFPEKVIKYLWDDAFKFNREIIFEVNEYQSLEQVIHAFMYASGTERFKVFKDNVRDAFANVEED
ncbi:McrB family protein [Gardnerella pickettii]|uniref:McrB family protein n=1 Tax=Gardnerella pickettii TaxID=2914924 RepID=UPI0039EEF6C5